MTEIQKANNGLSSLGCNLASAGEEDEVSENLLHKEMGEGERKNNQT